MHSSPYFKKRTVRRNLRGQKISFRGFRDMSNAKIRRHADSIGKQDLGDAVRARGVHTPCFRDGRRSRGKRGRGGARSL
jgi:hypothetical protein